MTQDIVTFGMAIDSSAARTAKADLDRLSKSGPAVEQALNRLKSSGAQGAAGVGAVGQAARTVDRELKSMQASASSAGAVMGKLAFALGSVFSVSKAIASADEWGQYSSRLKIAAGNTYDFVDAQERLMDVSNRVYKTFGNSAELYIRTASAMRELGYASSDSLDFVEALQYGLTVSAADAERSASVINAFSKSILLNKMGMEEYQTVVANAPRLQQALADSITGGSLMALQKLVSQGKLTADMIIKVSGEIEKMGKEADSMPVTFADAMTRFNNKFMEFAGATNQSSGAIYGLTRSVDFLGDHLEEVVAIGSGLGVVLGAHWALTGVKNYGALTISALANAAATREAAAATVIQAQAQLASAQSAAALTLNQTQVIAAQKALDVAMRASAVSAGVLSRAMLLVGGPIGAISLALGAGVTAWQLWGGSADEAKRAAIDLEQPLDELKKRFVSLTQAKRADLMLDYAKDLRDVEAAAREAAEAFKDMVEGGNGASVNSDPTGKSLDAYIQLRDTIDEISASEGTATEKANAMIEAVRGISGAIPKELADELLRAAAAAGMGAEQVEALRSRMAELQGLLTAPQEKPVRKPGASGDSKGKKSPYQSYVESLREQIALLGMETELEKVSERIKLGKYGKLSGAQEQNLRQMAAEFDIREKIVERVKEQAEGEKELADRIAETRANMQAFGEDAQRQFEREMATYGKGDSARALADNLNAIEDEYRRFKENLSRDLKSGVIDTEAFRAASADIADQMNAQMELERQHHEKRLAMQQNWALGATNSLKNYADEAANIYDSVGNAASSAFRGMEDALTLFVTTGKMDFASLADSIIKDMVRIAVQQSITGPLAGAIGSAIGSYFGAPNTAYAPAHGFDAGGYTGDGGKYDPAGIVHKGEYVLNQEATRRIGVGTLERMNRGYASGGLVGGTATPAAGQPNMKIELINQSSQQVQAKSGGMSFNGKEYVTTIVLTDLKNNGPIAQQLGRR